MSLETRRTGRSCERWCWPPLVRYCNETYLSSPLSQTHRPLWVNKVSVTKPIVLESQNFFLKVTDDAEAFPLQEECKPDSGSKKPGSAAFTFLVF